MAVFKYKDSNGEIKSLLNMVGPQGPQGIPGEQGPQGLPGEKGEKGSAIPAGIIVDYDGEDVPAGYVEVDNNYLESGVIYSTQMSPYLLGSDTFRFYNLTFRKTYTKPPVVIVSYFNNSPTNYGDIPVSSGNITTTGCRINFSNEGEYSNLGVSYVVIPVE